MVRKSFLACALALSLSAGVVRAEPEVFSKADFATDRTTAVENDRLHVLYFTASWCPPCRQMKKTTWVDESLVSWLSENAVVSAIDVDEQQDLAKAFRIRAMPTIVVQRDGEELARTVGYRGAKDLVDWISPIDDGVLLPVNGEDSTHFLSETGPIRRKYEETQKLIQEGEDDDVSQAFIDLLDVRTTCDLCFHESALRFVMRSMETWVEIYEPARDTFRTVRDDAGRRLDTGDVGWNSLADWLYLNGVIGDEERTAEWVLRISQKTTSRVSLDRFADEILRQADKLRRWDIFATVIEDPVAGAKQEVEDALRINVLSGMEPQQILEEPRAFGGLRPMILSALYKNDGGNCESDLIDYFEKCFGESDAWRVVYLDSAKECNRIRKEHISWLDDFDLKARYIREEPWPDETPDY